MVVNAKSYCLVLSPYILVPRHLVRSCTTIQMRVILSLPRDKGSCLLHGLLVIDRSPWIVEYIRLLLLHSYRTFKFGVPMARLLRVSVEHLTTVLR